MFVEEDPLKLEELELNDEDDELSEEEEEDDDNDDEDDEELSEEEDDKLEELKELELEDELKLEELRELLLDEEDKLASNSSKLTRTSLFPGLPDHKVYPVASIVEASFTDNLYHVSVLSPTGEVYI